MSSTYYLWSIRLSEKNSLILKVSSVKSLTFVNKNDILLMNELFIHRKRSVAVPRTEAENQRIREEQRAKILAAARKVFARKGIAATMADVAAAAEISQGLAYRYFANKDALFHALVEQTIQFALSKIQHILELPASPGERLELLVTSVLQARREHPEFFQLFQQVLGDEATPADLRQAAGKRNRGYQDAIRQLIVEGQATGEVAAGDPDQMITAIMACFEGLSRLALRDPEQVKNHFPDAAIILRMLKP